MTTIVEIFSAHFTDNHSENYPNIDINNLNFTEGIVKACWFKNSTFKHCFEVNICMDYNNNNSTKKRRLCCFIKPNKKYKVYEFEQMFGFKSDCEDYDNNKIVAVEYYNISNNDGIIMMVL